MLDTVERGFARGDDEAAVDVLLTILDSRAGTGDLACALAARALRLTSRPSDFAPDAMAAAVDRLVHLVREQEAQIRALQAMIESQL